MTRSCCWAYVWREFAADPNGYVLVRLTHHSRHVWQAPPGRTGRVTMLET